MTEYTYGTTKGAGATDSNVTTGHLLRVIQYPDSTGASDSISYRYNAQEEVITGTDPAGNVVDLTIDAGGRETARIVSTLAFGFNGAVRRIERAYTALGEVETITQYDSTLGGSVVDQLAYTYDGWGHVAKFEQDRNSAVGAAGSVDDYEVSYAYAKATAGRNALRRTSAPLPSGNAITYSYTSSNDEHDGDASRLSGLVDGATRLVTYGYNGVEQVVGQAYGAPDVQWLMYDGSGYPDLDRYDRVVRSRWTQDLSTDVDFYDVDITHDRNSNVVRSEDNVHPGFDVAYTVDDLDRLTRAQEGTWNGSSITSETRDQEWTLDHPGNWDNVKLDLDGDSLEHTLGVTCRTLSPTLAAPQSTPRTSGYRFHGTSSEHVRRRSFGSYSSLLPSSRWGELSWTR